MIQLRSYAVILLKQLNEQAKGSMLYISVGTFNPFYNLGLMFSNRCGVTIEKLASAELNWSVCIIFKYGAPD